MSEEEFAKVQKEIIIKLEYTSRLNAEMEKVTRELLRRNAELVTWIEAEYIHCRKYFSGDGCKKCRKKKKCDAYKLICKVKGVQG